MVRRGKATIYRDIFTVADGFARRGKPKTSAAEVFSVVVILTGPNGPVGPLIRALIGGAQPTMAGGPLSPCAIKRGGGRCGGINPYTLTTGPRPARIRGSGPLEDDAWLGRSDRSPMQGVKTDLEIKQYPGRLE